MIDFIKWCFQDFTHGFWTVVVGGLVFNGLARVAVAFRSGKDPG